MAEEWLVDGPKVIDVEDVRRVKVGLLGGQLDVVAHDEPGARVEVHTVRGRNLRISFDDGVLEVDHPQVRWDDWLETFRSFRASATADVSLLVPRAVALRLGVVTASVLVSGLTSDATVSTVGGEVVLDGLTGDVQVNSVGGEIAVRAHTGRLVAKTVSGDVTVAGDITVLTADSVSGDVFADLAGRPESIRVNTVSGAVTARLDDSVPTSCVIRSAGGRVQVDDASITGIHGRYTAETGAPGQPRTDVRVNTVSGSVNVLRAVRA